MYKVNDNFDCSINKLKSLTDAPKIVGGNFNWLNEQLKLL